MAIPQKQIDSYDVAEISDDTVFIAVDNGKTINTKGEDISNYVIQSLRYAKEKEATMSRTIQKNTQRKGEQYNGNIKRIIRKFIGKNRS